MLITRFLFDLQRANRRDVVNFNSNDLAPHHSEITDAASPNTNTLRFRGVLRSFGSVLVWETEVTDENMDYEVGVA